MHEITIESLLASEHAFMGSNWIKDDKAPADSPVKGHRYAGEHPCMICNDLFFWGSADAEAIDDSKLPAIRQAIADCGNDVDTGVLLWVARQREERPQGAYYSYFPRETWPLFDACGPERPIEFGNPYKPGEYKTNREGSDNG